MTSPPATSSDTINNGSKLPEKRKASAVCTFRSLHIGKSGTHFVRDVTFSGCSAPSWHRPLLLELNGETEVSHSVTAIGLSSNARQVVHRQAAERLALMGRAVSVSQSLPGLRSCQSQPHGCCLMSGFAAVVPTRPAKSVLGGSATSSASLQSHSNFISLHRQIEILWSLILMHVRFLKCCLKHL